MAAPSNDHLPHSADHSAANLYGGKGAETEIPTLRLSVRPTQGLKGWKGLIRGLLLFNNQESGGENVVQRMLEISPSNVHVFCN